MCACYACCPHPARNYSLGDHEERDHESLFHKDKKVCAESVSNPFMSFYWSGLKVWQAGSQHYGVGYEAISTHLLELVLEGVQLGTQLSGLYLDVPQLLLCLLACSNCLRRELPV